METEIGEEGGCGRAQAVEPVGYGPGSNDELPAEEDAAQVEQRDKGEDGADDVVKDPLTIGSPTAFHGPSVVDEEGEEDNIKQQPEDDLLGGEGVTQNGRWHGGAEVEPEAAEKVSGDETRDKFGDFT